MLNNADQRRSARFACRAAAKVLLNTFFTPLEVSRP